MANELHPNYHASGMAYGIANMGGLQNGMVSLQGHGLSAWLRPSSHTMTTATHLPGRNGPSTLANLFTGSRSFHFGS